MTAENIQIFSLVLNYSVPISIDVPFLLVYILGYKKRLQPNNTSTKGYTYSPSSHIIGTCAHGYQGHYNTLN